MEAERTMLQFDWEEVEGLTVQAVLAEGARAMNDGSLDCEMIAFRLETKAVTIRVNDDTDELIVSLEDIAVCHGLTPLQPFRDVISRTLGWCWVGRNYRGYLDNFTLGIDGIDPAYCFTGAGSSIQCGRITPIAA